MSNSILMILTNNLEDISRNINSNNSLWFCTAFQLLWKRIEEKMALKLSVDIYH